MIPALLIFGIAYLAIATERMHRTVVALLGAALMLACGIVTQTEAFHSREYGIDYNVIFLLVAMMVIVNILRTTGLFEWLAIWATQRAKGQPFRMLAILCMVTAVVSALLDNVTTVLLMAPVTLEVARRLQLDPRLYLVSEVLASNIGGTATLIGDPPNIMIASKAQLGFADFVIVLGPLAVLSLAGMLLVLWLAVGRHLRVPESLRLSALAADPHAVIREPVLLKRGLWLLGLTVVGFFFHRSLDLEPATIALLSASFFMLAAEWSGRKARKDRAPHEDLIYLMEVEWKTIFFFVGLFILVGGLVKTGVIHTLAHQLVYLTAGNILGTTLAVLWGSALLSSIVDNIPYVAAMNPLIVDLARASHPELSDYTALMHAPDIIPVWWALAAGACFGGNGTLVGASANVLVADLAQRGGAPISFKQFFLYGFPVMILTLLLSTAYLWLLFF